MPDCPSLNPDGLRLLKQRHPESFGPPHAELFFDAVRQLFGEHFDLVQARDAFKDGITFLRWAEDVASRPSAEALAENDS